jgi:hypothetical protein
MIVDNATKLNLLDIGYCHNLTPAGVGKIGDMQAPLCWLGIVNCKWDPLSIARICRGMAATLRRVRLHAREFEGFDFEDYLPKCCWATLHGACYTNMCSTLAEKVEIDKSCAKKRQADGYGEKGYDVDSSRTFWWNLLPPPFGPCVPRNDTDVAPHAGNLTHVDIETDISINIY